MTEFEKQMLSMMQDVKTEIEALHKAQEETNQRLNGLDQRMDGLDQRMDGLDQRMDGLDQRMDGLDQRMDGLDQRMDGLDQRMDGLDQRLEKLERRVDDLTEEVRANHAVVMEGFDTVVAAIGDQQMKDHKRLNETVDVVSRLCYDVEVLKRKVG